MPRSCNGWTNASCRVFKGLPAEARARSSVALPMSRASSSLAQCAGGGSNATLVVVVVVVARSRREPQPCLPRNLLRSRQSLLELHRPSQPSSQLQLQLQPQPQPSQRPRRRHGSGRETRPERRRRPDPPSLLREGGRFSGGEFRRVLRDFAGRRARREGRSRGTTKRRRRRARLSEPVDSSSPRDVLPLFLLVLPPLVATTSLSPRRHARLCAPRRRDGRSHRRSPEMLPAQPRTPLRPSLRALAPRIRRLHDPLGRGGVAPHGGAGGVLSSEAFGGEGGDLAGVVGVGAPEGGRGGGRGDESNRGNGRGARDALARRGMEEALPGRRAGRETIGGEGSGVGGVHLRGVRLEPRGGREEGTERDGETCGGCDGDGGRFVHSGLGPFDEWIDHLEGRLLASSSSSSSLSSPR
mmetsp:Transcript_23719/g.48820  ORF Transcript_23719/g.48820 Transcript_23719/m.48820 type:complete len:412 (+) Transcript_23719:565-1800(+)